MLNIMELNLLTLTKTTKMKLSKIALSVLLSGFFTFTIAQELPKASPKGKIEQTVGLTHISVDYSRPSVKERKIFGELLPFNEVWRLGANKATTLTTDQPLKFGDQLLPAGSYAMFATPMEDKWEVVFNSNTEQWGTGDYDKTLNVVSLIVETKNIDPIETLSISLEDITVNSGSIVIAWEKTMVRMPFKVTTSKAAQANIDEAIAKGEDLDMVYYNASRYYFDQKDTKKATEYINLSIEQKESFRNLYHKAKIEANSGDKKAAIKLAEKAYKIATEEGEDGWADYISGTIEDWKN